MIIAMLHAFTLAMLFVMATWIFDVSAKFMSLFFVIVLPMVAAMGYFYALVDGVVPHDEIVFHPDDLK